MVALAKKKNVKVISLKSKQANKKEFILLNQKNVPGFIFFNGHGNYDLICGQNNEILVQAGKNDDCLQGKIIYALSCRSAKKLGKGSVKKGAKAYLGYNEDFIFYYDREKVSKPLQDKIAQMFLEPSNLLASSLIKNHSAGKSWGKSQNDFKRRTIAIIASRDKIAINTYLPSILWDMRHQVCLGNKKVALSRTKENTSALAR